MPGTERDVRPSVGSVRRDLPLIVIALLAATAAITLFLVLNARRHSAATPGVAEQADVAGIIRPAPPLALPAPRRAADRVAVAPTPLPVPPALPRSPAQPAYAPPPYQPPPAYQPPQTMQPQTYFPPQTPADRPRPAGQGEAVLVIDTTVADATAPAAAGDAGANAGGTAQPQRSRATRLRQPGTTVAQGALIPAVLESALNSSQPGLARAIVSRDVRGFDGTRVLIPRGSRLIGEYRSDLTPGQRRAFLNWIRLVRPDGATIALGSPASDPLGRAGVAGKVDSHFLTRFGSAILRSVLDIGVNVASARIGNSPVIVGLPGSIGSGIGQSVGSGTVAPPTIMVRQGTAISVFVARDLDFTAVETRP